MGVKVRQKKIGRGQPWWVFISHNGKRTSRKIGDRRAAVAVARKIEAKLALGEFSINEKKEKPILGLTNRKVVQGLYNRAYKIKKA